ncbi:MAG: efflux RND transporter periplasmic adaptor subunit [Bacteroidales bacterium]|nr:efflux RND transporter periplasmic adaptor subunit [Bacteroidales bacterium]
MKRLLFVSLALIAASCAENVNRKNTEKEPVNVGVLTVTPMCAQHYNVYVGEINASGSAVISSNHSGILEAIHVHQGSQVKQGEVLAEVVSKNVRTSYEIAHATLRQAEDGYERVKKVHESGTVPDVKLVEIETQLAKAVAAARSSEESLEECKIKAPFNATVSEVLVEQGIHIAPGAPILKVVDLSTIEVSIPVPEGEIGRIKIGQKALIDVPALNITNIEAKVTLKGVTAAFPSHTYRCTLVPDKKQTNLYPGMVCKVRLSEVSDESKIRIPASAVEMDSNGRFVWTVNDGVVGRSYVTIDGYQEQGVVISSGLEPGDKVIVKGAAKVSTGMKVNSVEQAF